MNPASLREYFGRLDAAIKKVLADAGLPALYDSGLPPQPGMGDLGIPCFSMAKQARKSPVAIAAELAGKLQDEAGPLLDGVRADGPYVNLRYSTRILFSLLADCLHRQTAWARGVDTGERWMLEYSSPNTNKPLHLGHIRNNLLGMALARLLDYAGRNVQTVNLVNDRGIHISKTMLAYTHWAEGSTPESAGVKGDHFVGSLYVRYDREFKAEYEAWKVANPGLDLSSEQYFNSGHSALGNETREILQRWESGDPETITLWRRMNRWVLDGFQGTYRRMGCTFDHVQFESETYKLGKTLVQEGLEKGVFERREDGAVIFRLEKLGLEGEKVLLRPDGTSVYMTQDLGTAVTRFDSFNIDRLAYVVGDEQLYHFQLLFGVLDLLRPGTAARCRHVAYGMIRLPEGRMKSREGTVVDADELMDELNALAKEEIMSRAGKAHYEELDAAERELRAERIAQAALKYHMFRFTPKKSFEYNPKESIDFLGQTGPYCLYTYARTRSLLRKVGEDRLPFSDAAAAALGTDTERALMMQILAFPAICREAAENLDPSRLSEHLYGLCKAFNLMFADKDGHPVTTCADPALKSGRLALVDAAGLTIKAALGLLGIETLEEM